MLLLYLDQWQLVNSIDFGPLSSLAGFGFSLTDAADHFQEVIATEVLVIIAHKLARVEV
jgi:hypothetical protein